MPELSQRHLALAEAIAARYTARPQVEAVAVAGSLTTGQLEPGSDIDMYVYVSEPLPIAARTEIATAHAAQADNPYKQVYARKITEGRAWYEAMPFVCAALARHIYHSLKFEEPYDVRQAFRGKTPRPGDEQERLALEAALDERFEVVEANLLHLTR